MKKPTTETVQVLSLIVLFLTVAIGGWTTFSYFEAKSYNKLTKSNVSTWDAMFVDLRVQDSPKE